MSDEAPQETSLRRDVVLIYLYICHEIKKTTRRRADGARRRITG